VFISFKTVLRCAFFCHNLHGRVRRGSRTPSHTSRLESRSDKIRFPSGLELKIGLVCTIGRNRVEGIGISLLYVVCCTFHCIQQIFCRWMELESVWKVSPLFLRGDCSGGTGKIRKTSEDAAVQYDGRMGLLLLQRYSDVCNKCNNLIPMNSLRPAHSRFQFCTASRTHSSTTRVQFPQHCQRIMPVAPS
jgi:hypothetical protein